MQKSTGGARPRVPSGESSKARGLAPHARATRGEGAPEAGSRRRSRGKRWRALRSTCRGKALRVGKVASFDERAMESILVLRTRTANAGRERRARGSVRGRSPVRRAVENAAVGQPVRARHLQILEGRRSTRPKLLVCRQAHLDRRSGSPKGAPAPADAQCAIAWLERREPPTLESNGPRVLDSSVGCRSR